MIRLELLVGNKMICSKVDTIHSIPATKKRIVKKAMEIIKEKADIVETLNKHCNETQKALMKKIYETYGEEQAGFTYVYVEPANKRKSNKIKLNTRNIDGSIIEVEATLYKTKVESFKKYNLYIYKDSNDKWILTEAITGAKLFYPVKNKKDIEKLLEEYTNLIEAMDEKIMKVYKQFGNANPHLLDTSLIEKEAKKIKKLETEIKDTNKDVNKDIIINKLKEENLKLYMYDDKLDKLNEKNLQKILERLPDGGDIKVKIDKKIHVVEIDIDIFTNEVDFNILTKEEYIARYGDEFFED